MKRGIVIAGIALGAAVAYLAVKTYREDEEIRTKVDASVESVTNLVQLIQQRKQAREAAEQKREAEQIKQNQAWADQQWEALGI